MSNSKIYLGSTNLGTGKIKLGSNDVSAIYLGTSLLYPPTTPPTPTDPDMLCFTAQQANSSVGLNVPSGLNLTLYKSTDGVNFSSWDGSAVTLSNVGDKLYVYGNNQTLATDHNSFTNFAMTGQIAADGDVTYLLQNNGLSTLTSNYALCGLFENCTSLTTAPSLPSTTLSSHCYGYMFYGCSGLTTAPSLPSTTLANGCYYSMFERCSNLTTTPSLPATTLANSCYYSMFSQCTSLTTAPSLPATTLAQECYMGMFGGCSNLVNAPSLPATTLANSCYYSMFHYCTSLTTAPDLMAQTLEINCYFQMFDGCSNLNSVTCLATDISAASCTSNWLRDVAQTGTFTKDQYMSSWTTGIDGIPSGWTVEDYIELLNPTVTITSDDGEGNYDCYFTAECTDTIFQSIDGQTLNIYVDDNGSEELVISDIIDAYSDNYSEVFRDFAYTDPYDLTNGGRFEIVDGNDNVITSGNWTYANVTGNCDNLTFPTVNSIEVEETADGWIGRITLDDDLSNYDGYNISIDGANGEVNFSISNDLMDGENGEYVGNNTFEVGIDFGATPPTAGTYNDFTVSMSIGKFDECNDEYTDLDGEVITL